MRKNAKYAVLILGVVLSLSIGACVWALDTFDLSYTLLEGGYNLELTPDQPYKSVKVDITTDVACRYEIIQRVISPLQNRNNPGVIIANNFVLRGLRGTNQYGDFRLSSDDSPVKSQDTIYVSDTSGSADTFTIVFGITGAENLTPGNYTGRVSLTLSPIGANRSSVTKMFDVFVNIEKTSQAEPSIDIATASGSRSIVLNYKKEDARSVDVLVKINGKFNKTFSINQVLTAPFESLEGQAMDSIPVSFAVKETRKGLAVDRDTPLTVNPQAIYTSSPNGDADESFIISYNLQELGDQKAGRYRSRIQYLLEQGASQIKLDTLDLEIEHQRVLDLVITPEDQKYAIEFYDVKSNEPPKESAVIIEVDSNIGKPYQVSQEVPAELASKEGNAIPGEYFTLLTESQDTKGKLMFTDPQQVKKGSTVLFVSDKHGSSDKFRVVYHLESPKKMLAGDYATRITYSILEF